MAMLPLLAVSAYGLDQLHNLARVNQRLTERQLIGLQIGLGVVSRLQRLEEYWRKYTVSHDDGYVRKFEETLRATRADLDNLHEAELSSAEEQALQRFTRALGSFAAVEIRQWETEPHRVFERIEQLTVLAAEAHLEARRMAEAEAKAAAMVRDETLRAVLVAAGAAVVLSTLLILLGVRSLRSRLQRLIRGTQTVSKGAFSVQLDDEADDELGRVARAFNQMVMSLQQLERIKADFISSVSHELRTPLVAMLETNRLLLDEVLGPLTEKQRRLLQINNQAADRLSNMITDLLELSRLKARIRYEFSEQELVSLTRSAVSELEAMALERGIALTTDLKEVALHADCDPERYVQVVQNLVENALKYTPSGGQVCVSLERSRPGEPIEGMDARDCAVLSIEDSGPGIPPADRERVFEKFFRREGTPAVGGMGLGLAICREVVQAHAGTVWITESELLGGAAVRVALPLNRARSA